MGLRIWFLGAALVAFGTLASCKKVGKRGGGAAGDATPTTPRVVSLSPSTTEALFALGAGALVVGRSRFCDTPPEARALPVMGGYSDPNFEAIFAAAPTLVVGARGPAGPALEARLRERGIATAFPETESVAQIWDAIGSLGRAVGRDGDATRVVEEGKARLARTAKRLAGRPRPRVLMLFDLEPVVAAGPGSFTSELIALAGGENVVAQGGPYPVLSVERVLGLDPDVVLDTTVAMTGGPTRLRNDTPGFGALRAVRAGRVVGLRDASVLRPGPRVAEAVERIAVALHPE